MESVRVLACSSYVDWREPMDIARVHVLHVSVMRGKDNRSDGRLLSGGD